MAKKIYQRAYDNPKDTSGKLKPNKYLGEFEVVEQITEDMYAEEFIGKKDGKYYLVKGVEVSGFYHPNQGGVRYSVVEMETYAPKSRKSNE